MSPVKAVLFDRDGTLVHDVPYNGDPERVRPVDGAREAVALLRAHGIRTGVVTNQSGIARGLVSDTDVRHVNRRIDDLIGPFDVWAICPHGPEDGCHCRKPRPGLVLWAAGRICAAPADCVVIGDIGADTEAAERAGAHGILVPNDRTRPAETATAAHVAPDLLTAVRTLLTGPPEDRARPPERPDGGPGGQGPAGTATTATARHTPAPARDGHAPAPDGHAPGSDGRVFAPDGRAPATVPGRDRSAGGTAAPGPDGRVPGRDGHAPAPDGRAPAPAPATVPARDRSAAGTAAPGPATHDAGPRPATSGGAGARPAPGVTSGATPRAGAGPGEVGPPVRAVVDTRGRLR